MHPDIVGKTGKGSVGELTVTVNADVEPALAGIKKVEDALDRLVEKARVATYWAFIAGLITGLAVMRIITAVS